MTPIPTTTDSNRMIGKLCVGGAWACAHGDFGGLRFVAQQLSVYVPEPFHGELVALACLCNDDPDRAAALWNRLKDRL